MSGHWYERFEPSVPRAVRGGIKSQSKRGKFGESWWAQRWISVLESFNIGARLGRGRSYARGGQVISIDVGQGTVHAQVQGSRPSPYSVKIKVRVLRPEAWKKLGKVLASQALFAAKLLAGEMPQDIEKAFREAGLSLFPERLRDLETDCSCPDWSNPCKHIAAVYYLLGEEFDRDPFVILKLRGIGREELIGLLEEPREKGSRKTKPRAGTEAATESGPSPALPIPCDPAAFWGAADVPAHLLGEVREPPVAGALLKRLGNFPFWRAGERFLDTMEPVYSRATPSAIDAFLGLAKVSNPLREGK